MDENRRGTTIHKTVPSMKWMAFALVLIVISSSQVHYQRTSQINLILFSVRHGPKIPETEVEPPKLRFADEFVCSPFLNYGVTAEHQIMPMSSFFSSRASMNSVVPAGSCHRSYILMPIPESRTVIVLASESYLIQIPNTFRIEGTRTYLRKRNV